ncbi:MAG TPA: hypothetical protein VES97_11175 [Solirubrobacteraceae bacterium]|nr:hypothetical protein [Solirubrobacteraceae bacterium]
MTDRSAVDRPARPPRSRGALAVIWVSAALFLAVLALLAARVAAGQDPALRARAAATPLPPRRVLVRRILERRVIVHLPPSAPPQPTQASQQVSAAGGYASGLPVTRTS